MNVDPVVLLIFIVVGVWVFFVAGHQGGSGKGSGGNDPEAARLKAQALKEAAIQSVIDAELRARSTSKHANSQIAHLSRLPTNPQDGSRGLAVTSLLDGCGVSSAVKQHCRVWSSASGRGRHFAEQSVSADPGRLWKVESTSDLGELDQFALRAPPTSPLRRCLPSGTLGSSPP